MRHYFLYPIPRPDISVERFRKLALPEEDRRLVVIVTHLGIAAGGVCNDGKLAQCRSLCGSKSAAADLQAIGESGFRCPPLPALNACTKYAVCRAISAHFLTKNVTPPSIHVVACEPGRTTAQQ
jgi:hypothetical protein